jgi:hypothetical protein
MDRKSILFICPAFFGYENVIKSALVNNGYEVDFFDERTSNNSFLKAIFRVKKSLLNSFIERHYESILKKIENKHYDYFFLIKGEVVPESFIVKFKELNPQARLVYYTYDSIKNNNKNSVYILKHFDDCFSFDFEDVKTYPTLRLKHLFYSNEFVSKANAKSRDYNISFVGTLHSNRFSILKKLFAYFNNTFVFYYMPAKWFFYFEKFTKKEFKQIEITDVSFDKLSKSQVAEIFKNSKSVLDIQRFGQTGLTMRTFEVLAAGAKLITTNNFIKSVPFYNSENIIVLEDFTNEDEIRDIVSLIDQDTIPILEKNYSFEDFEVNKWVREFFEFK